MGPAPEPTLIRAKWILPVGGPMHQAQRMDDQRIFCLLISLLTSKTTRAASAMNPFNLEDQYQFYLEKVELKEDSMHPTQRVQLRQAFMGASGIILLVIRDEFSALSDEDGDRQFTSMIDQVSDYWNRETAAYIPPTPPPPLRPLTSMTHEEFTSFFGVGFAPSYAEEKIAKFTSLYRIHYCIGDLGDFDTYDRLVEAGFDVTFSLDRKES